MSRRHDLIVPAVLGVAVLAGRLAKIKRLDGLPGPWWMPVATAVAVVVAVVGVQEIWRRRARVAIDPQALTIVRWRKHTVPTQVVNRIVEVQSLVISDRAAPRRWVFIFADTHCIWRGSAARWNDAGLDQILAAVPAAVERWDGTTDVVDVRAKLPGTLPWSEARPSHRYLLVAAIALASLGLSFLLPARHPTRNADASNMARCGYTSSELSDALGGTWTIATTPAPSGLCGFTNGQVTLDVARLPKTNTAGTTGVRTMSDACQPPETYVVGLTSPQGPFVCAAESFVFAAAYRNGNLLLLHATTYTADPLAANDTRDLANLERQLIAAS